MRITKVSVKKLFGIFDHEIPLNQDTRITIIHGPNGVGKTILLRMIDGLFNADFTLFHEIPFEEFRVEVDARESIIVSSKSESVNDLKSEIHVMFDDGGTSKPSQQHTYTDKMPDWFVRLIDEVSTRLIGTQRLQSEDETELYSESLSDHSIIIRPKVRVHSESLAKRISDELRYFDNSTAQFEKLKSELQELESLESDENVPVGVADKSSVDILKRLKDIMDNSKSALSSSFERNELVTELKQIIDGLFLFKQLLFSEEGGFFIVAADGKTIPLTSLSSGEQHQLVLFYELLFDVPQGSLIMIDEPEISLHVNWQEQFLNDVQRVSDLRQFDVLIATHSPDIIGDKHDWMVGLGEWELA